MKNATENVFISTKPPAIGFFLNIWISELSATFITDAGTCVGAGNYVCFSSYMEKKK